MSFDEALRYLLSLGHETLAIKLGLAHTELLLEALGNPQGSFQKIQIAGTNGKGSTAAMLDTICRAAQIRTGLYTSPHLVSITERICINGHEITQEDFALLTTRVRNGAEQLCDQGALDALPTFFEHVTAIALLAFKQENVELAILETGLGGRLDATTAARAKMVAITPIALDHQEYLGATLAEIAAEKAAIIRSGVTATAVIAPQPPAALEVILKKCRECSITPLVNDCVAHVTGASSDGRMRVRFESSCDVYENVLLNLRGRHQVVNATVAISLAEALRGTGFSISRAAVIEGLETVSHPGRLEFHERNNCRAAILFDGAHNADGAQALRDYLREFVKVPITLVFGAMRDKDLTPIAAILFPKAETLILTKPNNERSMETSELLKIVPTAFDQKNVKLAETVAEAITTAKLVTKETELILITGSLYLVGEAQEILKSAF